MTSSDRILITGGCGFIGVNLAAHLLANGATNIRVYDNESLGTRANLNGLDVEFVRGDIRDKAQLTKALFGVSAVVHLAADTRVMDSIADPEHNFNSNVIGTFNLLTAMREMGVNTIINASTGGAILGERTPPVHENMVPEPAAPYGASKLAVEGYLSAFGESYGFSAISLRFSNVYGPRSFHKGSVVAAFLKLILAGKSLPVYGDGTQIRDYVYIDDLCEGISKAIRSGNKGVYQLGTGTPTTINDLIDTIRTVVGPEFPFEVEYHDHRAGELLHTYCDISKARDAFGYIPTTQIKDGIEKTWQWFLSR